MNQFMTKDFLLTTQTAKTLYHDYASKMPIIDYHCHVNPKEIYDNVRYTNISQLWLSGDHYKWRIMRLNGVDEYYITGGASDKEKFLKFAEALPKAIGNPMYHWCHLELKTYFGYEGVLNKDTAEEVWEHTEKVLAGDDMGVRDIIRKSRVTFIGTTDDPCDSLEYHKLLAEDETFETVVAPSFRPDKALAFNASFWRDYISAIGKSAGMDINSFDDLKKALSVRIEYFDKNGCRASDHGMNYVVYNEVSDEECERIFALAKSGSKISESELEAVQTSLVLHCAGEYKKHGWVMQIHYNCLRNPNTAMFNKLGPDTGFDCIGPRNCSGELAKLLDTMYNNDAMPRLVLYSLDSGDNAFIDTLAGSFQQAGYPGTLQHGSAWWFNDTKNGMREQMTTLASLGLLGNFIGMLTDSRSFLSYTRHEYFRRILCQLIGEWVENGEYPADIEYLGQTVQNISYNNAKNFFGTEV